MRPSCLNCVRKHLGQAAVLLAESRLGYPDHVWLAMGHLAEASDELVADYPQMAAAIRTERKHLEEAPYGHAVDIMRLIRDVSALEGSAPASAQQHAPAVQAYTPAVQAYTPASEVSVAGAAVPIVMASTTAPPAAPAESMHEGKFMSAAWWTASRTTLFGSTATAFQQVPVRPLPPAKITQQLWLLQHWPKHPYDLVPLLVATHLRAQRLKRDDLLLLPLDADNRLLISPHTWNVSMIDAKATVVNEQHQRSIELVRSRDIVVCNSGPLDPELGQRMQALQTGLQEAKIKLDDAHLLPPGMPYCSSPRADLLTSALAPAAAGAPGEQRCVPCEEKKRFAVVQKRLRDQQVGRRVVIMAALNDFRPSYSLTSVILDQARALSTLPDTHVQVWIQESADIALLPKDLGPNVSVLGVLPKMPWKEDVADDTQVQVLVTWLARALAQVGPAVVITHDLVFQSWFLAWAKAIHQHARFVAEEGSENAQQWYHMMHSSVGMRPQAPEVLARCSVPEGHRMVALNTADVPYLQSYYQARPDQIVVIPNPRDVRVTLGMGPLAAGMVSRHRLHLSEIVQVYPLSAPRMSAKGVSQVIDVFAELRAISDDDEGPRLVILDAHANGQPGKDQRAQMRAHAQSAGLPDACLVFLSEHVEQEEGLSAAERTELLAYGADAATVRHLFQVSNVFVYPTTSEAGPLVLQEAALAGNLLVLNESLPALRTYVAAPDAFWVPWGSVKESIFSPIKAGNIAGNILSALGRDMSNRSRRAAMRRGCLETYAATWLEVLRSGAP